MRTHFETEAQENSEMAYYVETSTTMDKSD